MEGASANEVGGIGPEVGQDQQPPGQAGSEGDFWGNDNDPWGGNSGAGNSGGDGGAGGDGDFDWF